LLLVQHPAYTSDISYLCWLARCYIMNRKARNAWELYLKTNSSSESARLLQLIANDCYRVGAFLFSAKAFDNLERMHAETAHHHSTLGGGGGLAASAAIAAQEYWEGKRGACVGVFQQVIAGMEGKEALREVLVMLRNSAGGPGAVGGGNPQAEYVVRVITKWLAANN
jgi:intraflagellar transport protein 56